MINYVTGDATSPVGDGPKIIAHVCNDIGVWGAGFVLAVSRRWRAPERVYRASYNEMASPSSPRLGDVQIVNVADYVFVANMIAQRGVGRRPQGGPPIDYDALERCLEKLADMAWDFGASVHMPRIGCGLAGGRWEIVEPIIKRTLGPVGVPVTVYDLP